MLTLVPSLSANALATFVPMDCCTEGMRSDTIAKRYRAGMLHTMMLMICFSTFTAFQSTKFCQFEIAFLSPFSSFVLQKY